MDLAVYGLIVAAVAPLALLAVYVVLSRLKAPFAERMLDALMGAFHVQMVVGAVVNVIGGSLILALAIWIMNRPNASVLTWLSGSLVILLGVWRLCRGLSLARAIQANAKPRDDG